MIALARGKVGRLALLLGAALALFGCDTGGLLVAEGSNIEPPLKGHSSTELVSGGTLASNGKYKLFYVLGQPTPQQGVATSPANRLNGGLTGAVQTE